VNHLASGPLALRCPGSLDPSEFTLIEMLDSVLRSLVYLSIYLSIYLSYRQRHTCHYYTHVTTTDTLAGFPGAGSH